MELGAYTVDQLGGREQKEADNFGNMFCCIAWLLDVEHFSHFSTSNSWKVARLFFVFSVKWSSPQINDIIADGTILSWGIKIQKKIGLAAQRDREKVWLTRTQYQHR